MVNIDQPAAAVAADTSLILREILQTKENALKHCQQYKDVYSTMQDSQNIKSETDKNVVSGNEINGDHLSVSDKESVIGSDEGSSFLDQSRVDEMEDEDAKSENEENGSPEVNTATESKQAKRERVENLLSSMQHPGQFMDPESLYGNEVRRQKRKQTLPQQHESVNKARKIEGQHLEEELYNIRNHINAVQNFYDNAPRHLQAFTGTDNLHRMHQAYYANMFSRHPDVLPRSENSPPDKKSSNEVHREEVRAKERKLTDDHFNIAEHVRETMNANKGLSQSVACLDDKEINELITSLKSKIEEAVSVTVDKELATFFQKRNNCKSKDGGSNGERHIKEESYIHNQEGKRGERHEPSRKPTTDHSLNHILQLPDRPHHSNNNFRVPERHSAFELPTLNKLNGGLPDLPTRAMFPPHPPLVYPTLPYLPTGFHAPSLYSCPIVPPEQTEALALVVNTPKKKRTKVTDTRLSPRAARALLQENGPSLGSIFDQERSMPTGYHPGNPSCLPTSVAIPNPSLHHSDILNFYKDQAMCNSPGGEERTTPCSSNSPSENGYNNYMKTEFYNDSDSFDSQCKQTMDTLTPMHLRKAKLMFFYCRYPSSAILKVYFPDVQFNKNNTAQLVKWFSNFREFYYIQMEKYARQAIAEGCTHKDDLTVTTDSELYRVLNLHYNRNNQIEVPEHFRSTIQATLQEFFDALMNQKDREPSWKKPIYKVIARKDDVLPDIFKSPNWMDQLGDS